MELENNKNQFVDIRHGDCKDVLKSLADNSVDAIVTDPPYELTSKGINEHLRDAFDVGFNVMLPDFQKVKPKSVNYFDFVSILRERSSLGRIQIVNVVKSAISVPKRSVNFNNSVVAFNKEVGTGYKPTCSTVSNSKLVDKANIVVSENIGNYVLDFGNSFDFSCCDIVCRDFGHTSFCSITVPISAICTSFIPDDFCDGLPTSLANRLCDIVGFGSFRHNDNAFGSSFVMTSVTAKDEIVLVLNLCRASGNSHATITTRERTRLSEFGSPKLIRACTTTCSFSSVLEPINTSIVCDTANGTCSFDLTIHIPKLFTSKILKNTQSSKGFMGKDWDGRGIAYDVEMWKECKRVLRPGGHLLAFGGSRTYHRMAVAIEDAGFEIRDEISYYFASETKEKQFFDSLSDGQKYMLAEMVGEPSFLNWLYGSGFPKSHNIGKAVDKLQGNEREVVGKNPSLRPNSDGQKCGYSGIQSRSQFVTVGSSKYEGWGTALKPAHEPIVMARKPLSEKTIAKNVLKHGTGGINIDGCRVDGEGWARSEKGSEFMNTGACYGKWKRIASKQHSKGRFPANIITDGSDEVKSFFPNNSEGKPYFKRNAKSIFGGKSKSKGSYNGKSKSTFGNASRFFYVAKASKKERNEGLDDLQDRHLAYSNQARAELKRGNSGFEGNGDKAHMNKIKHVKNHHPTVKPIALMRYLIRLVTPENGIVLDPFCGSGTTGCGSVIENMSFIGIEREAEYIPLINSRIKYWQENKGTENDKSKAKAKKVKKEKSLDIFREKDIKK